MDNQNKVCYSIIVIIIVSLFHFYTLPCLAQEKAEKSVYKNKDPENYSEGNNTFFDFYQKWISPVKGINKCPMHPSCSQYAKIAFEILPWYKAYTKSLERLLRCGHELYLYPTVLVNGELKWYDPVSINDSKPTTHISKLINHFANHSIAFTHETPHPQIFSDEGFADFLVKEGEYDRAITEYYRLLYNSKNLSQMLNLLKKIGLCYFQGSDYDGYILFFNKNDTNFQTNSTLNNEMTLYLAKSYYHLNQYQKSISSLEWSSISTDDTFYNEGQYLLALSYARVFDWQKSIEKFNLIVQDSSRKKSAEHMINSLKNFPKLPKKRPFLAGTLSAVVPGSGYIYCDRKATGVASFLVNGLLIWAIRDAMVKKQYGLAGAVSFFEIGWYTGNITGSVDAAYSYNVNVRNQFIDRLLEKENLFEYVKNSYALSVIRISVSLK